MTPDKGNDDPLTSGCQAFYEQFSLLSNQVRKNCFRHGASSIASPLQEAL